MTKYKVAISTISKLTIFRRVIREIQSVKVKKTDTCVKGEMLFTWLADESPYISLAISDPGDVMILI